MINNYIKKIFFGCVLVISIITGVFCLFIYGQEIINSFNENDKSLLFWYLPFLFVGIFSCIIALLTVRWFKSSNNE